MELAGGLSQVVKKWCALCKTLVGHTITYSQTYGQAESKSI